MPMKLVVALVLLVSLASAVARPERVNGVGFDTAFPPIRGIPHPHLKTPMDTRLVSERIPQEAQLSCIEVAPVNRIVNCDILTWDTCGNVYGRLGNETHWRVEVRHSTTGKLVRLLSNVIHVEEGVNRFYFTPTEIGAYTVRVFRRPELTSLPDLTTPADMEHIVIVHDTTARCTSATLGGTQAQLRQTLWSQVSRLNELKPIVGVTGISKNTNVAVDYTNRYNPQDSLLQQQARRAPLDPLALQALGAIPRSDDNNFQLCDIIQQS